MRATSLVTCMVAACGGGHGGAPDASPDVAIDAADFGMPSTTYPAAGIMKPEITSFGGPVMSTVRVVPIFYADEASAATYGDFLGKLAASTTWTAMTGEYGVGALTVASPVTLSTNAPARLYDSDLRALLTSALDGTHPEYGPVDAATLARTVFLFHTPSTTVASGPGSTTPFSCDPAGGYHYHFALPSTAQAIYAIAYDCPPPPFLTTTLQQTTSVIAHELVEAATDPLVDLQPAWALPNRAAVPFAYQLGAELADMCELVSTDWFAPADLGGYTIERSWSEIAAKGFHDPCAPLPPGAGAYFVAVPDTPDTVMIADGTNNKMPGTLIQAGGSRTIDVAFLSDGPTSGDWTIDASESPADATQVLQLALDRTTGQNGNKVHLTITALSRPAVGVAFFKVRSTLGSEKHAWWAAVGITP